MANNKFKKLTETQVVYFSNLLTLKKPKWEADSTSDVLIQAKVDPIPHQVEAAQFVFRNPFQGGVILGDEVGLGKTIETGLVLSQLWAEGKRKILILAPKSLRHQWQDELRELFYLDSDIIDTRSYSKVVKGIYPDPLKEDEIILITNEHFIAKYDSLIQKSNWDLIVIDEAHKLRNVWKPAKNQAKRAKTIRSAISPFKKMLLTATPMQNNLMELYGLCTFLDPYALGTAESFKRNFISVSEDELEEKLSELKFRISKFFKRELRKNVQAFIPYTNRNAVTIPFDPTDNEEELRVTFENYLKDPETVALPPIANGFLRLVYFKLLASSSFALKNSLNNLYVKLIYGSVALDDKELFTELMSEIESKLMLEDGRESQELQHFKKVLFKNVSSKTFEGLKEHIDDNMGLSSVLQEEGAEENYDEEDLDKSDEVHASDTKTTRERILTESQLILHLIDLSRKLTENSKGSALIHALGQQFRRAKDNGWPEKAVIFTEFKTTQEYVISVLEQSGMNLKDDIVIFNGDSGTAEERRQLVEDFRGEKKIFLTTEAGAEGLNLQFCNLLINYDLPWNPQRIEQRIGRCHRYGQKLDVVVVNFANKKNIADQRILELLKTKFQLFEGTFGASNTVLGEIESGTDIEKEILNIYLTCRDEDEITAKFDDLLSGNSEVREAKFAQAKNIIMSHFDEEVQNKLKSLDNTIKSEISERESLIRDIVLSLLPEHTLGEGDYFTSGPNSMGLVPDQPYSFLKGSIYQVITAMHPSFKKIKSECSDAKKVIFRYTDNHSISMVSDHVGSKGEFVIYKVHFNGIEEKEVLIPLFINSKKEIMTKEFGEKLLSVTSEENLVGANLNEEQFSVELEKYIKEEIGILNEYNEELYNEEIDKLDTYFEDLQELRKREIADIEKEMSKLKKERRRLKLDQAREINIKIQKLKGQIIKKEEEITQFRKESADKEKDRLKELNELSEIKAECKVVAFGEYEIL